MSEILYLDELEVFNQSINKSKLVVVDFTASWCGPCKAIAPIYQELANKYTNCDFYKVDVDDGEDIAAECQIKSMPTFNFYKNGKLVSSFSGNNPETLKKTLETYN